MLRRGGGAHERGGHAGYHSPEGFGEVVRGVWLSPARFFGRLDPEGGLARPALFAALVLYVAVMAENLLRAAWRLEFNYGLVYAALPVLVVALVLGPLLVAGLATLVLTVLDGAPTRRRFGPMFRALGYATAVALALPIPFAPLLVVPYGLYVATAAVRGALFVDWRRAAFGALAPLGAALLILLLLAGPEEAYRLLVNPPGE